MEDQTAIEKPKSRRSGLRWVSLLLVLILIGGAFRVGYISGRKGLNIDAKTFKVVNQADQPTSVDYNLLWDTISVLNQKYIDKPVSDQKILYGAVKGAVEASGDPYTEFFTPDELQSFKTDLKGSFDGIGAEIGKKDGSIVVISPIDGSPAKEAGIRAKDIILKVNNEMVNDWSVEQAVDKIRGPKGTQVTLNIFRDGFTAPKDFIITRQTIEVKSIKWVMRDVTDAKGQTKHIAVLTLSRFGDDTEKLFVQAAKEIMAQKADGIILDLRNDPGGYLDTAVHIASYWVKKGDLIVTEAHSNGKNITYNSEGLGSLGSLKTITLINGGSASAAEILSGALHDHQLTTLIGEKSFGKGSVQEIVDLPGNSALKVTVAKWITPGGKNLNKDGLNPDIEVKLSDDDVKNEKDPQLDTALAEIVK